MQFTEDRIQGRMMIANN